MILVTGAGGWLGTELVDQLIQKGECIRALNNVETEKLKLLKKKYPSKLEIIVGDICDINIIKKSLEGIDIVYHLAAKVHFTPTNKKEEEEFYKVNTEATKNIFEQSIEHNVKRVIFFSTVSVYKNNDSIISIDSLKEPETIYGKSKLAAEAIGLQLYKEKKLPITIIEPVTVYGEGDVGNFKKLENLINKGICIRFGDGKNNKTVIYYKDLIKMVINIAKDIETIGKTFICGTECLTINEINRILIKQSKKAILKIKIPKFITNILVNICCFSKLKIIKRKIKALTQNNEFNIESSIKYIDEYTKFEEYYSSGHKNKKVLFVATVTNHINAFHIPYLKMFKDQGYEVHVASNGNEPIEYCDKHFNLQFARSPFKIQNIKAYKQLKKIINDNRYKIIHCHTPVGGVLTRLAARKSRKKETRVIYTAHGFHFFKGAPIKNWLIYYPVEKYLSKYTDCLITINKEDYELAKRKFKTKDIEYVPGVGVDKNKFDFEMTEEEKKEYRKSLHIDEDDFVFVQVGELNNNKNQIMTIEAIKELVKENNKIKLLLVGIGDLKEYYENKIKEYSLEKSVFLLGYRNDVPKLLKISDVLISTSKREGLPVNILEAMFAGLPIIATNCRGNRDLVPDNNLVEIDNVEQLKDKMRGKIAKLNFIEYKELNKYTIKSISCKIKNFYENGENNE